VNQYCMQSTGRKSVAHRPARREVRQAPAAIRTERFRAAVPRTHSTPRRGVVLVVVLVLVVLLALAGFGFVAEMTTEYEATKINGDLLQARQLMASAESYLCARVDRLKQTRRNGDSIAADTDTAGYQAVTLQSFGSSSSAIDKPLAEAEWRFAVVKNLSEFDAVQSRRQADSLTTDEFEQADGINLFQSVEFGLSSESAKLNLGRVLHWDMVEPGRGRRALMQIPGMTDEAADSILDWIDADDTPRQFGAERDYYRQQQRNVQPRNGIPESLTELLFVRGVDHAAFWGTVGLTELDAAPKWERLLTVTSAESTESQPSKLALDSLTPGELNEFETELAGYLPPEVARYVTLALMNGVAATSEQLPVVSPMEIEPTRISVQSISAAIELPDLIDSFVLVTDSDSSRMVQSPLQSESAELPSVFARLEQLVTTVDTTLPVIRGRIDILTAGEEVLRALTDDPFAAAQIVQQRESLSEDERRGTVWLLSRRILDLAAYRSLYADITTGGDVFTGEIIVYRPVGGPFLRRRITVDAANGPARRTNWLDQSSLPLPLTLQQLEPRAGMTLLE
jgi:Tfp pilus assembly protein PilX